MENISEKNLPLSREFLASAQLAVFLIHIGFVMF